MNTKKCLLLAAICSPLFTAAQFFSNVSANLPGIASGENMDVRAADLDEDGDLDLVFAREFKPNVILKNNGNAVFTNGTPGNLPQEVHDSEDVAIADFNADGHLDLVFCSEDDVNEGWTNVHEYYLGDGTGKFSPAAYQPPDSEANAVITTDLNGDGFPDLIFGNKGTLNVLINNGLGAFASENNRVPALQRTTQDLATIDVDGDGDLDILEGNENGNLLFINDGTGFFTDETPVRLPLTGLNLETRKIAVGDVDGDGDLDIFLANVNFLTLKNPQNRVFLNDGTGHFSDATGTNLPKDTDHSIDAIFEDIDLDNDLDLVIANVFGAPIKIYANNGSGVYADSSLHFLGQSYQRDALGVIAADLNNDGYRDLYFCHRATPQNQQKDLLLLRLAPSNTIDNQALKRSITIFPNPVSRHFFIQSDLSFDTVEIKNAAGLLLQSFHPGPPEQGVYRCELSGDLPVGTYFLGCYAGGKCLAYARLFKHGH